MLHKLLPIITKNAGIYIHPFVHPLFLPSSPRPKIQKPCNLQDFLFCCLLNQSLSSWERPSWPPMRQAATTALRRPCFAWEVPVRWCHPTRGTGGSTTPNTRPFWPCCSASSRCGTPCTLGASKPVIFFTSNKESCWIVDLQSLHCFAVPVSWTAVHSWG